MSGPVSAGPWTRFQCGEGVAWRACPSSYDGPTPQVFGTKVAALVHQDHDGWSWTTIGNAGQRGLATRSEAMQAADAALVGVNLGGAP
jgi:hypothetical protein